MPLRISMVGPVRPYRGGIAQFTDTLADRMQDRGHDVQIITFSRQYPRLLFPGRTQFEPGHVAISREEGALIDSINPISWRRAADEIARHRPKAVLFQYWLPFFAPSYGWMAARLNRQSIPVLAVLHNVLPHERRIGDEALGRYFLRKCCGALALSEKVAADARSLGVGGPVRVAAHPVYEHFGALVDRTDARERLGIPHEAEVLLFFGFVRAYKGLQTLLEAMPEISRRRPNALLLVAGEFYDDEAPYRAMVASHNLESRVRFDAEYISEERVADYFAAANLVVQPYRSATQSGVVQTAYHFERPVVVTDVGGLAEVVPDGVSGFVVPPEQPGALADAVVRFFEAGLEQAMVEGVREVRQRYTWDRLVDEVERLIATATE